MTVNSASVTDDQFAALVKHYGEKDVAAMVLSVAWANFQDRLVLCLGSPLEPGGPLPPLDVVFAPGHAHHPGALPPSGARPASNQASSPPVAGKDLVEDDSEWTNTLL